MRKKRLEVLKIYFYFILSGFVLFSLFQACSPYQVNSQNEASSTGEVSSPSDLASGSPANESNQVEGDTPVQPEPFDNGGPNSKLVSILVGYGPARTIISCDGGESWVANRYDPSVDDVSSFAHHENRSNALVYNQGYFYYMEGWAANPETGGERGSRIFRSPDGINWTKISTVKDVIGFTIVNNTMVISNRTPEWSDDLGVTWTSLNERVQATHVSMTTIEKRNGGKRVIAVGDRQVVTISDDNARTWVTGSLPANEICGGIPVFGNNVGVLTGNANLCYSLDEGETWLTSSHISTQGAVSAIWDGSKFMVYRKALEANMIQTSLDGINWTDHSNLILPTGRGLLGKSQIYYDKVSKKYIAHDRNTFLVSDDGFDFKISKTDPIEMRGQYISHFAQGAVSISEGHPCF